MMMVIASACKGLVHTWQGPGVHACKELPAGQSTILQKKRFCYMRKQNVWLVDRANMG